MPSEITDGQARVKEQGSHAASTQTDQNAGPPTHKATADKQTTTTDRVKEQGSHATSSVKEQGSRAASEQGGKTEAGSFVDFLDIPDDVRKQISPASAEATARQARPEQEATSGDDASREASASAEDQAARQEAEEIPGDEEEQEQEEEQEEEKEGEKTGKIDKRQKRINRLTRQKHQLEDQLDAAVAENREFRAQFEKLKNGQKPAGAPIGAGRLAHVGDEKTLAQEVARANAVIEWCDANPEGATTGEGENQKFVEPAEIGRWRREAQKIILNAPERREEIREFTQARAKFDQLAVEAWPDLTDKSSKDFQLGSAILAQFPEIAARPEAAYAVGLVIEGMKALQARGQKAEVRGQNGEKARRDISPRAFEPRVPLAPHTANPPSREVKPSSQKKLNEAKTELMADPDGGAGSLTKVFAAMEH